MRVDNRNHFALRNSMRWIETINGANTNFVAHRQDSGIHFVHHASIIRVDTRITNVFDRLDTLVTKMATKQPILQKANGGASNYLLHMPSVFR